MSGVGRLCSPEMQSTTDIETAVHGFIARELLEDETDLESSTELVRTGIVDSINVLRLVDFLEEDYDVELEPTDIKEFTTISKIARIVAEKAGTA